MSAPKAGNGFVAGENVSSRLVRRNDAPKFLRFQRKQPVLAGYPAAGTPPDIIMPQQASIARWTGSDRSPADCCHQIVRPRSMVFRRASHFSKCPKYLCETSENETLAKQSGLEACCDFLTFLWWRSASSYSTDVNRSKAAADQS